MKLIREEGDRRMKSESDLFYRLRNVLRRRGEDVIKKEMSKDGHMVSDGIYYVRSRNVRRPDAYAIYDSNYAVRDSAEEFNREGEVTLDMTGVYHVPTIHPKDWTPKGRRKNA